MVNTTEVTDRDILRVQNGEISMNSHLPPKDASTFQL